MIIYKDCVSGDELLTDTFNIKEDDAFYVVQGKIVQEKGGEIDDALIGGNASAEAAPEDALDPDVTSGVDVVLRARMVETGFNNKKEYQDHLKIYMAKVVEHLEGKNPGRVADFKKAARTGVKMLLENFKDCQFFVGESMNPDSMHVVVLYEGETPMAYFFKDGLESEKV